MDGSCSNSHSSFVDFLKYLPGSFGRCENQYRSLSFLLRVFRALMPSRDRKAVMDTITIATAASAWCQNNTHTKSNVFFMMKPETRTMEMMIIQTLKHKKMPRKVFCRRFILTFQINMRGSEMTTYVPDIRILKSYILSGLTEQVGRNI